MKHTEYNDSIQKLHEAKMKQVSLNHSSMIWELILTVVMGAALVTLVFI